MKKLVVNFALILSLLSPAKSGAGGNPTDDCGRAFEACELYVVELEHQAALFKRQRDEALEMAAKSDGGSSWLLYVLGGVAVGFLGAAALK